MLKSIIAPNGDPLPSLDKTFIINKTILQSLIMWDIQGLDKLI